jgi:hypothetical protein
MRNLCFTERSLQFSKFTHKSLGNFIPLSSLFFLSLSLPYPLLASLSLAGGVRSARGQQACAARSGCARALCQEAAWEACASAVLASWASGRPERRPQAWLGRSRSAARAGPGAECRRRAGAHERVQCTAVRLVRLRRACARRKRENWNGRPRAHGGATDVELRRMRLGHVQMQRGKAEANAGPATGGGGGAVQDNDEQLRDVLDDGVPCGGCERIRMGAAEPRVEDIGGR